MQNPNLRRLSRRGALVLPASSALLAALAWCGVAHAQVACGDRIGAGAQAILAGNLTCPQGEVLTVEGPAVLDLNGFVVRCTRPDGFSRGIVLVGRGATVRNGFVQDCETGILLSGDGRHLVRDVTVVSPGRIGIDAASDRGRIKNAFVFSAGNVGIDARGDRTIVTGSSVSGSGSVGIRARGRVSLTGNVVAATAGDGFQVSGEQAVLAGNRAVGNETGFNMIGDRGRFVRNEAQRNVLGFDLDGSANDNVLTRNDLSDNERSGLLVIGDGNRIRKNRLVENGEHGILLFGEVFDSVVAGNEVTGNGELDLSDDAPACGTNRWRGNTFGTRSQDCIE